MRRAAVRPTLSIMTIDRRTLLRRMGRAAAAGTFGAALAATAPGRPARRADRQAPVAPPGAPHAVADESARWTALRPPVVPRGVWQTEGVPAHLGGPHPSAASIRAVFVHHTDSGNDYAPGDVPRMIESFYDGHIEDNDWDDIGYNFLVDRTGTVYEGRAGGIDNAVIGAHTKGFNVGTVGIAAIGSFGPGERVPEPLLEAIARLSAWKLGRYGVDPRARTLLTSTSDEARYRRGERALFHTVAGHRDGYRTDCPGDALYGLLPAVRRRAYVLQGSVGPPGIRGCPVPPSFLRRAPT